MHCITPNRRTLKEVEVVDFEKRRVPSKHYVYIINVSWNDGSDTVIYRRYSMFFDFQIILLETFPWEGGLKEPSARKIPFLPGKILFRRSHIRDVAQKRLKPINEYCRALVKLPDHIAHCDHVLDFFEVRPEDLNPSRDDSRRPRPDEQEISEISGPLLLEPYVAVADYLSTQQKELSITDGDKVEVIEKNENGWWLVSNDDGERGWVPGVYLERPDGASEDLVTKRATAGQGEQYITTQEYTAENPDEISFGVGVTVEVLQKNFEGWWLIRYNGKEGNAPAPFLEKHQNWTLPNKVEIISSIHDLKQKHTTPSTNSSVIDRGQNSSQSSTRSFSSRVPASPLSPTSISYRGKVLPPPKRSSIKRPTKRPNAPPPLPPGLTQDPTYEYLTIASFDANIPDGVSFEQDKKVQVLDKSPGGWWFVKVGGHEGWAPATYIEKREIKTKPAGPSRPKLPTVQKSNSSVTRRKETQISSSSSGVRKGSLNSITISHPILQNTSSVPAESFPAKRPLPPVPLSSKPTSAVTAVEDAYEDIADTKKTGSESRPVTARTFGHSSYKKESGKEDFRSHLKSKMGPKPATPANSAKAPPRPSNVPEGTNKVVGPPKPKHTVMKPSTTSLVTPTARPAGFNKFGNIASQFEKKAEDSRKSSVSGIPKRPSLKKIDTFEKPNNNPPRLPAKPKPLSSSTKSKPKVEPKNLSTDDGVVKDFRSVLRSTQNKNPNNLPSPAPFHSQNTKKPWDSNHSANKGPSVPKKPAHMPLKPPITSKFNGGAKPFNGKESASNSSGIKSTAAKPEWRPGEKPVLRRFQQNNNSNVKDNDKKSTFTVAHARFELSKQLDLSETLSKRGSPDGQADCKLLESSESPIPVSPPERKKKLLKALKSNNTSKPLSENKTKCRKFVIAISDFTAREASEVSFCNGDKMEVINDAENEWWFVKVSNREGWAPSSFFIGEAANATTKPNAFSSQQNTFDHNGYDSVYSEIESDPNRPRFPAQYVALADFLAKDSSMASLRAEDIVTVTQEAQGGWWYVTHSDGGGEGWVPSTYLEAL